LENTECQVTILNVSVTLAVVLLWLELW